MRRQEAANKELESFLNSNIKPDAAQVRKLGAVLGEDVVKKSIARHFLRRRLRKQVVMSAADIAEFKEVLGEDEYNALDEEISEALHDLKQSLLSGGPTNQKDIQVWSRILGPNKVAETIINYKTTPRTTPQPVSPTTFRG